MKRTSALVFLLLSAPGWLWAGEGALSIVSKTPLGRTESRTAMYSITATFNEPMIPLTAPGEMGEFCPVRLEPAVKGRCRWQGTQTVAFEPETPLAPATEYKVTVPAGTASKVSGDRLSADAAWTFETLRPALVNSIPHEGEIPRP